MIQIISDNEKIGTSRMDLYILKMLHVLSFKRAKWLEKRIQQHSEALEALKNRRVF